MLKVNNVHVHFLDEEEEYRLLGECKEHRNELSSLRPEDIDFARGLVSVRAGYANNVEGRSVPTSETPGRP